MKICWDNLEKLRYSKRTGKWYTVPSNNTLVYKDICIECGDSYLGVCNDKGYCSIECSNKNKWTGKIHSIETREKMSKSGKGRTLSIGHKRKISESKFKKNGVCKRNIPIYDTYAHQISYAEQVRRNKEDENILEVKCTYCGKWYIPKRSEIRDRVLALNGKVSGELRLYCSNDCKQECPIYKKVRYSSEENNTKQLSREVQSELRQMVFERDGWTCQKCKSKKNLHCHHITGIEVNPIESADVDNCITYCKKCHKKVHKQKGCSRNDYKRKKCE